MQLAAQLCILLLAAVRACHPPALPNALEHVLFVLLGSECRMISCM